MEAMRQSWTDDRLDALNEKVDLRFDRVDHRLDLGDREVQRRFDEVERRLDRADERFASLQTELRTGVTERLDSIQRSMIHLAVGLTMGMLAGFAAMVGLVATQL
jgi:hypothetical protein